jgi:thiamine-phosphate pyrophosphorylase
VSTAPAPVARPGPRERLDLSLYLVTDSGLCAPRRVADVVRAAVAGGVTTVQVRDKLGPRRELLAQVRAVQEALADHPSVTVLVNDAVDVALLADADGVHLGQDDLPAAQVRTLLGPELVLGLSIGTAEEAAAAAALGDGVLDYWGVGPVWATATKPEATAPIGLEGTAAVAALARAAGVRTAAIGGIDATRAAAVRACGVDGVCVVSAVCSAPDPRAAAAGLLP